MGVLDAPRSVGHGLTLAAGGNPYGISHCDKASPQRPRGAMDGRASVGWWDGTVPVAMGEPYTVKLAFHTTSFL